MSERAATKPARPDFAIHKFLTTRVYLLLSFLASSGWLAIACGTSVGDGATDDGTTLPPASSTGGNSGGKAGATNQAGVGGAGVSASSGETSGSGGSVGPAGSSGSVSSGGSTVSAGGSTNTVGNAGGGTGGTGGTGGDMPAQCGDGIQEGSEECDDKTATPLCSSACTYLATPNCVSCEGSYSCSVFTKNCIGSDPPFTLDQQDQCVAVMRCVNASNCFDGTGSLDGTCYCGTLSLTDCRAAPFDLTMAGAPSGPCAAAIQAGFSGAMANGDVLDNLSNNKQPAGAALQRLNCEKFANTGSCANTCGF